ncbi:hypothetical protein F4778DRAFT_553607 [Xylariomycetidae sp. FL2044]|nr:hypothetical protein F4778DRAFT_553607 [Xylariomycetidae sp. FL2044]
MNDNVPSQEAPRNTEMEDVNGGPAATQSKVHAYDLLNSNPTTDRQPIRLGRYGLQNLKPASFSTKPVVSIPLTGGIGNEGSLFILPSIMLTRILFLHIRYLSAVVCGGHAYPHLHRGWLSAGGWVGVEITTPALHVQPDAFDKVLKVCESLRDTFWIYNSQNSGLHIHVVCGPRGQAQAERCSSPP